MQIQGTSDLAYTLQIKSAQMANNQQEMQGKAALELLESAAMPPAPASSGSAGSIINTYA
uniref:hypothetical protein n=1 Tax=Ningiella ruwaisensis TaxID=2364274 RepID=UPI00109EF4DA|nr:hypothetical protein [Ningiella ruwaisensis]